MPKNLRETYDQLANDPDLVSLRDEIAGLRTRRLELLKQLDCQPPPWGSVVDALVDLEQAEKNGNKHLIEQKRKALSKLVREGKDANSSYLATWREVRELDQEIAKLMAVQAKIEQVKGMWVHRDELMAVLQSILNSIDRHVPKEMRDVRQAIQRDYDKVLHLKARKQVPSEEVVIEQEPCQGDVQT